VTDQAHRERMLDDLMARGNVSRKQWRMSMRRQALLCKMAGQDVTVSDQEMQEAFEEEFGRKVVVRHIQSASLEESRQAMERLKAGEDFAALARQVSKNSSAEDGGLLPAIGARPASVPAALQKAAWAMTSPGETAGPTQVGTSYHILRLERIVEPPKADLAEVKDQLASQVKYRKLRDAKGRLLRELIDQAQVRWVDPALAGGGNAGVEPGGMGEP